MVKGAVVEFTVPAVFKDVLGAELITEPEDAVRTRFRGIKVVLGAFEGSKLFDREVFGESFDREVFGESFDREAGKIVRHSMCFSSADCPPFILFVLIADCSSFVDW